MTAATTPTEIGLQSAGKTRLSGETAGAGPPILLLHGLSATRRHVVQGSRYLAHRGYRLIACDARGHGSSAPAPQSSTSATSAKSAGLIRFLYQ